MEQNRELRKTNLSSCLENPRDRRTWWSAIYGSHRVGHNWSNLATAAATQVLWCWRRLLRVPWTARRSNQSILKEISPGCSLEGLMLNWNWNTLATWCKELTHLKRPWCWERLKAGGEGDDRGWDGWMASTTQWTWVWVNSGSWWWTGRPGVLQSMGLQRVRQDWATELNWMNPSSAKWFLTKVKEELSFQKMILEQLGFSK